MHPYKISRYTIVSDSFSCPFSGDEERVIYNSYSGNLMNIKDSSYKDLRNGEFHKLNPFFLEELAEKNFITHFDTDELNMVLRENRLAVSEERNLFIAIQPTASCQLGCDYCAQKHVNVQISTSNEEKLVARVAKKIEQNPKVESLEVAWFGGEPLSALQSLKSISIKLQQLALSKGISYTSHIVTNGIKLNSKTAIELHDNHHIKYAEITIDGDADIHNKRRAYKNGLGSFDRIYDNLKAILLNDEINLKIRLRCNVDIRNKEDLKPLIERLKRDKIHMKLESFYFAPIRTWGVDLSAITTEMFEFSTFQIKWFVELFRQGFRVNLMPKRKRITCMAMSDQAELYDAFGNVFSCSEVSYIPEFEIKDEASGNNIYGVGHLDYKADLEKRKKLSDFYELIEKKEVQCHQCELLPVCGGSCPKAWKEGYIACPPEKFNIKQRLVINHLFNDKRLKVC